MIVVVAIANEKGSVGKSTTAVNIDAGLCLKLRHNRKIPGRVLFIDLDPQMKTLMSVAYGEHSAGSEASISELLVSDKPPSPQRLLRRARHHPNLHFIPGNKTRLKRGISSHTYAAWGRPSPGNGP